MRRTRESRLALALLFSISLACGREPASADDGETADSGAPGLPDGSSPTDTDAGDNSLPGPEGCPAQGAFPSIEPGGAWADLDGLRDQALRDALCARINEHYSLTYNDARRAMLDAATGIDVHGGQVECVYTGRTVPAEGATSNGINVEHTWPQNEGAEVEPERSDLHHLFPADSEANLRRASYPFAYTDCDQRNDCLWSGGGCKLGIATGGSQRVFEVRPERRGEIARAHFYFAVRYEKSIEGVEERALRCWNWIDPPDDLERARNDAIEAIQHNRNPFVDRPDLVESIADF